MIHLKKAVRSFVQSKYLDLFGAALVLVISIYNQYHLTYYFQGNVKFEVPFSEQIALIKQGAFPLGIFSTIGAVFSLLSTRFVGKQNNVRAGKNMRLVKLVPACKRLVHALFGGIAFNHHKTPRLRID